MTDTKPAPSQEQYLKNMITAMDVVIDGIAKANILTVERQRMNVIAFDHLTLLRRELSEQIYKLPKPVVKVPPLPAVQPVNDAVPEMNSDAAENEARKHFAATAAIAAEAARLARNADAAQRQ